MSLAVPPPRVLKLERPHAAAPAEEPSRPRGWNLTDFESDCDTRLDAVRDRCRALLGQAVAEAEDVREKARAEGLEAGRAAGLKDAESRIAESAAQEAERLSGERIAAVLPPLQKLTTAYRTEQDRWRADWERDAVALACGIAGRLLGRELAANPVAAAELVAEALAAAAGAQSPTVALHPDDLAALGERFVAEVTAALGPGATLSGDATLSRGDCVIRTADGEIDARLATRLDRIAAELLPQVDDNGAGGGT